MKAGESLGKALRRVVAILAGQVNDLCLPRNHLKPRQIESSVPDIFTYGISRHDLKPPLKIKGRNIYPAGRFLCADIQKKVFFHIINGLLKACRPFHPPFSFKTLKSFSASVMILSKMMPSVLSFHA